MNNYPMYPGQYNTKMPYSNKNIVDIINECEAVCESMTTMVKNMPNFNTRIRQSRLLRDCADMCTMTAKAIARNSVFSRGLATSCAQVCEACGTECARFADANSQHCASVCLHCARVCRNYSIMM